MTKGKIIFVDRSGVWVSNGYALHGASGQTRIADSKYVFLSRCAMTRRFLRAEITGMYKLGDGCMLAVAKKGLFFQKQGSHLFKKVFAMPRGSKPLNICEAPSGKLFFGEYFQNMGKEAVNIYGSACSIYLS